MRSDPLITLIEEIRKAKLRCEEINTEATALLTRQTELKADSEASVRRLNMLTNILTNHAQNGEDILVARLRYEEASSRNIGGVMLKPMDLYTYLGNTPAQVTQHQALNSVYNQGNIGVTNGPLGSSPLGIGPFNTKI